MIYWNFKMKIIDILKILSKYGINEAYPLWAEHDIIGFYIDPTVISSEDMKKLKELGVYYDREYCSLAMFV